MRKRQKHYNTLIIERTVYRNREKVVILILFFMTAVYCFFLLHNIKTFPDVFLDEGNCMYDSWCMAFYGVDSNLIRNPVYLPGFKGQGQSILYPFIAGFSMRLLGYNLFAYRLPLLIISIINFALLEAVALKKSGSLEALLTALVIGTAPYILTLSRWGMDCNIAPFIASIGTITLYLGYSEQGRKRMATMIPGGILLGLVTYSYNVGWMYIPIFLIILIGWLFVKKKKLFPDIIPAAVSLIIIVIPILIFAIRSNIPSLNTDKKILWWTSPCLLVGRVKASFIDFDGNIILNIFHNLIDGYKMYIDGSDGLSWNSVGNMGPYYMFAAPFFIVGFMVMLKRQRDYDIFILSSLAAMLPIMMVVTPNYNHWIFLHFPVLITIAAGICSIIKQLKQISIRRFFIASIIFTYVLFFTRFTYQYFNLDRYTGWETSAIPVLQSLDTEKYAAVYFVSDSDNFLYFIRFCLPISPYEYQATRDHPYSKTQLGTSDHYANFERIGDTADIDSNTLFIIENSHAGNYAELLEESTLMTSFMFDSQLYDVYVLSE